ncbi:MAG TPA: DUF4395 domain-containing protein [Rubrobacteraceae bacterium]|jgi:hypothetical protein|nr:DUF4395 domain-containing protein [Rubrobacteraceae bacterium]
MGAEQNKGIPSPIVKLNRWFLVLGVVGGLLLQEPLFTTVLFIVMLSAVAFGRRGSLIFQVGKRLLAERNAAAQREDEVEDPRLMRLNNTIAAVVLGGAQLAFLFGQNVVGWALSLAVAVAAGIALAGFCVGCFLYFRLNMYRHRLFGQGQ